MQALRRPGRGLRGEGARGQGESGGDGHHLGVHGEGFVRAVAGASHLVGSEGVGIWRVRLRMKLRLGLQSLLEFGDGRAIEGARWQDASLQGAAVETRSVGVIALTNYFATANDNRAVFVVKR